MTFDLDITDLGIVDRLARRGRTTWADLASELGLTAPAIAQRVRRLEDRGVIRHYAALLDPAALGAISAFVAVALDVSERRGRFVEVVRSLDEVQSCDRIAGEADFLLKVNCLGAAELDALTSVTLPAIRGLRVVSVAVVLASVKDGRTLPLPAAG